MAPIFDKITLPKGSIKTQNFTNGTKLITQSEAPAPEVIVVDKLLTDLSVNSGLTGETRSSATPEKRITKNKINKKSLAMSTPKKDPIPNQDKNTLGIQKYQCLLSHAPSLSSGFKSLRNKANDDNTKTTDNSCTDKDDTSHTNRYDSI